MGLTGACSNQPARPKIAEANRVRAKPVAAPGCAAPASQPAPRSRPSTTAIVEVLRLSGGPLAIEDIVERVEQRLGRTVKRVSVKASLAEMAASPAHPCGAWHGDATLFEEWAGLGRPGAGAGAAAGFR